MKRTKIRELWADAPAFAGQTLTVCGWGRTIRDMKNFGFLELNDGSAFKSLQVVLAREVLPNYDEIVRQNVGAAFIVRSENSISARDPQDGRKEESRAEGEAFLPRAPVLYYNGINTF